METAFTALGGGLLGAAAGSALAVSLASRMHFGVAVSPASVVVGLAVAAVTGLLAGVLPARRAALLEPAVALR
jgi:putative ABC transport system permease protein